MNPFTGTRHVHTSWRIALCSLCFVVGVMAALQFRPSLPVLWGIGGIALLLGFMIRRRSALALVVIAGLCLGLAYGGVSLDSTAVWQGMIGSQVVMTGRIKEDPSKNKQGATVLQLHDILIDERRLPGTVWAAIDTTVPLKRSQVITLEGQLATGFGTFQALLYRPTILKWQEEAWADPGRVVRDYFSDAVRAAVPEPQASLGLGFLTGQKSALPLDVSASLQIAGLTHIVVASGYNLTILVRLSRRLCMRISKFTAAVVTFGLISAFISVTGLSPSMTRAGLVSALSLLVWYYGRQFHPFVLLPFAAALTVLWQPSFAWGDLGWQLSFVAFAGVMIVAPLLQAYFFGQDEPGVLRQILGETIAAHVVTLPIIVVAFGTVSNVAIIANLLVVPLVPLAMLLTFLTGIITLIVPSAASFIGLPATWLLIYMTHAATVLAELPWAQTELSLPPVLVGVYYLAVAFGCLVMWRKTRYDLREANIVV